VARETIIRLTDDLDGSEAVEELTFALRGVEYEIDLNAKNVAALEKALDRFLTAGRKVPRAHPARATRASSRKSDPVHIREWARANGLAVSSRGRIPAEVRDAYEAAQG
jgi:hypothetical protein